MGFLLVTGFEPFGGDGVNPSAELARVLDGRVFGGGRVVVRAGVLPVSDRRVGEVLGGLLAEGGMGGAVDGVVCFGQDSGGAGLKVERVFLNWREYPCADEDGVVVGGEGIVADGPGLYWSSLPVDGMVSASNGVGVAACCGRDAGGFLCNQAGYLVRHLLTCGGRGGVPAGFVHVPMLPSQAAGRVVRGVDRVARASMSLETALVGIEAMLEVVADAIVGGGGR